nr:hypothetical protein [Elizabethkingia sp. ASV34]
MSRGLGDVYKRQAIACELSASTTIERLDILGSLSKDWLSILRGS